MRRFGRHFRNRLCRSFTAFRPDGCEAAQAALRVAVQPRRSVAIDTSRRAELRNNYSVTTTIGRNWLQRRHAEIMEKLGLAALEIDQDLKDGFYVDASKKLERTVPQIEQELHKLFTELMEPK